MNRLARGVYFLIVADSAATFVVLNPFSPHAPLARIRLHSNPQTFSFPNPNKSFPAFFDRALTAVCLVPTAMADDDRDHRAKRSRFDKTESEPRRSRFDRRSRSPSTRHSESTRTRSPDPRSPGEAQSGALDPAAAAGMWDGPFRVKTTKLTTCPNSCCRCQNQCPVASEKRHSACRCSSNPLGEQSSAPNPYATVI